jgi:NAD-dependent SIR2 family protein deacetylase
MKREKRLTKRERKALNAPTHHHHHHEEAHIHCIACGRHLDAEEFEEPVRAKWIRCNHGSEFPSCVGCEASSRVLIEAHDRSNQPVKSAAAWH